MSAIPLRMFLIVLLTGFLSGFFSAYAQTTPEEPHLGDAEEVARADLDRNTSALRRDPANLDLRHARLRLLHTLSVEDVEYLHEAREELDVLRRSATAPEVDHALWIAYEGALDVVEARHAFWPRVRMQPLRRGLPLLDSAVSLAPNNVEIRSLRLTSGYYLPFFLGRKEQVRQDFEALSRLLPGARGNYPLNWYLGITDFVLEKGDATGRHKQRLEQARERAAAEGAISHSGARDETLRTR